MSKETAAGLQAERKWLQKTCAQRAPSGSVASQIGAFELWNDAQAKLDGLTLLVGQLNSLASQVTTQASVGGYIVDNVRAPDR